MIRIHLGDDDFNRFGTRILKFAVPVVVNTPVVRVLGVREFRAAGSPEGSPPESRTVDVALGTGGSLDRAFLDRVRFIDDQLLAASDLIGADPDRYRPLVVDTPEGATMKIKLAQGAGVVDDARSFTVRMDHVWFMGERWGVTWRAA